MAFEAGPDAAMAATVSRIQATTTMRLWARTQRVSDDTFDVSSRGGRGKSGDHGARPGRERHPPSCGFAVRLEDDSGRRGTVWRSARVDAAQAAAVTEGARWSTIRSATIAVAVRAPLPIAIATDRTAAAASPAA